jgi:hypothetical protein
VSCHKLSELNLCPQLVLSSVSAALDVDARAMIIPHWGELSWLGLSVPSSLSVSASSSIGHRCRVAFLHVLPIQMSAIAGRHVLAETITVLALGSMRKGQSRRPGRVHL